MQEVQQFWPLKQKEELFFWKEQKKKKRRGKNEYGSKWSR